jgi:hypothetical protein
MCPPAPYLLNLGAATGLELDQVRGVLAAVAPIAGSARRNRAGHARQPWIRVSARGASLL